MNSPTLIDRSNKAKAILDSPVYQDSYEMVRSAIINRIESCALGDVAAAEDLRKCLRLLRDVRANIELVLNQGKIASFALAQDEKRRKNPLINFFR